MMALQNHYYSKSESERRKHVAKDKLKRLFYRNETTFSLEKYVTKTKQKFNLLQNYNSPIYKVEKFRQPLDKINSPNKDFKTEVNICVSNHSATFETDYIYLSTVISRLLPATQQSSRRY